MHATMACMKQLEYALIYQKIRYAFEGRCVEYNNKKGEKSSLKEYLEKIRSDK